MRRFFPRIAASVYLVAQLLMVLALCLAPSPSDAATKKAPSIYDGPLMRFVVVRGHYSTCEPTCPEWISAEGAITSRAPPLFKSFLKTLNGRRLPLVLDSPGGEVDAALVLGRMIRAAKLDTTVGVTLFSGCSPEKKDCKSDGKKSVEYSGTVSAAGGACASACPLMFAGGVRRVIGQWSFMGVHQITTTFSKSRIEYKVLYRVVNGKKKIIKKTVVGRKNAGTYSTTKMSRSLENRLAAYLKEMGVDKTLLDPVKATPAAGILRLSPVEMLSMKLITSLDAADLLLAPDVCKIVPVPGNCREIEPAELAQDMRLVVVRASRAGCEPNCPEWISAQGKVRPETSATLKRLLKQLGDRKLPLVVSSSGGSIEGAMALGRLIRKNGLAVAVGRTALVECDPGSLFCNTPRGSPLGSSVDSTGSRCTAECLLVLAGGAERLAGRGAIVRWDEAVAQTKSSRRNVEAYFKEMGVPTRVTGEQSPALLTEWTQWRLQKMQLLTSADTVEKFADRGVCNRKPLPTNCRTVETLQSKFVETSISNEAVVVPAPKPAWSSERPMQVFLVRGGSPLCEPNCPEWISMKGAIASDTPAMLEEVLGKVDGLYLPIIINSDGGDVLAAMAIGRLIRDKRLIVAVGGTFFIGCEPGVAGCAPDATGAYAGAVNSRGKCNAACPIVLAGGIERLAGHYDQIWLRRLGLRPLLKNYFAEMGVGLGLLTLMDEAQFRGIELDPERALRNGLVTGYDTARDLTVPKRCLAAAIPLNCRVSNATTAKSINQGVNVPG